MIKSRIDDMELLELTMHNSGGIDDGFEEALKARPGQVCANYSGYHFHGYVWFENEQFHAEIWRYGSPVHVYSAETLRELVWEVASDYGPE